MNTFNVRYMPRVVHVVIFPYDMELWKRQKILLCYSLIAIDELRQAVLLRLQNLLATNAEIENASVNRDIQENLFDFLVWD